MMTRYSFRISGWVDVDDLLILDFLDSIGAEIIDGVEVRK